MQENLEGDFEMEKTLETALVSITWSRLTNEQGNRGGRPDAATPTVDVFGVYFIKEAYKCIKMHPKIHSQIDLEKA